MDEILKIAIESMPNTKPDIITIFSGLLTPIIAIIVAYIAYQQHRIDKKRLRNELYDRRAEVFAALELFLLDFNKQGYATYERIVNFYTQVAISKFLFEKDVQKYLVKIYEESIKCYELHLKLYSEDGEKGLPVGKQRTKVSKEKGELKNWISNQLKESQNMFKKYFDI